MPYVIGIVLILALGIGIGKATTEPEVIVKEKVVTEEKVVTKTVTITEVPELPTSCASLRDVAAGYLTSDSDMAAGAASILGGATDAQRLIVADDPVGSVDALQQVRDAKELIDTASVERIKTDTAFEHALDACQRDLDQLNNE